MICMVKATFANVIQFTNTRISQPNTDITLREIVVVVVVTVLTQIEVGAATVSVHEAVPHPCPLRIVCQMALTLVR